MKLKNLLVIGITLTMLFILFGPQTSLAQGPMAVSAPGGKLAVTPAGYDDMGAVLKGMGYEAEEISENDLGDLGRLKQYSAVYINCSSSIDSVAEGAAGTLKQYVQEGGFVYASDYANSLISQAFPGKISFYKGTGEDAQSSRVGNAGEVQAEVTDAGMAAALGTSSIKVNFDLGAWVVMESTSGRVYMRGSAPIIDYSNLNFQNFDFSNPESLQNQMPTSQTLEDVPYVVSFSEGQGEVLYTSFHNEAQTTADVSKVLNWFATRTQASGIAQSSRALASSGEEALLEIVDSLNKSERKTYAFLATGEAAFSVVLNFSGSTLDLKITDPKGKTVEQKSVSSPPYQVQIKQPLSGKYVIEVIGKDVPQDNYPFVVTVLGKAEAAAPEQVTAAVSSKPTKSPIVTSQINWLLYGVIGVVGLFVFIVAVIVIIVLLVRRKKAPPPKT